MMRILSPSIPSSLRGIVGLLLLLLSNNNNHMLVLGQESCGHGSYTDTIGTSPLTLSYVADMANGVLHGQVVYEGGNVWVGFAVSPSGGMIGAQSVIGDTSGIARYNLAGYTADDVTLITTASTPAAEDWSVNDTHSVLVFDWPLENGDFSIATDGSATNFLLAAGISDTIPFHAVKNSLVGIVVTPCLASTDAAANTMGTTNGTNTTAAAAGGAGCDPPPVSIALDAIPGVTLTYDLGVDPASGLGTISMTLVYDGQAWLGIGISPTGKMQDSIAIIGLPDQGMTDTNPGKYLLGGYTQELVTLTDQQTLLSKNLIQNGTHTELSFTKFLVEPGNPPITTNAENFFVLARGVSNTFAYHGARQSFSIMLSCTGGAQAVVGVAIAEEDEEDEEEEEEEEEDEEDDVKEEEEGGEEKQSSMLDVAVTEALVAMDVAVTEAPVGMAVTEAPVGTSTSGGGPVDCGTYVSSYTYPGLGMTLNYVVTMDEDQQNGNFSAQLIYEGKGWISVGISPDGAMVGSLAIIGIPGQPVSVTNPGKYMLNQQAVSGVNLLPNDQQTLMGGNIEQNDTHTVLTFIKRLVEPGEISIVVDGSTINNFLAAAGIDNDVLGFHIRRGNAGLGLSPCTSQGVAKASLQEAPETDPMQPWFRAHGWMACIAWGVLVPVAIGNSLCRHLIPGEGIWFQAHRALNSLAIVMTIISFGLVVNAVEKSSTNPDHFKPDDGVLGKHKTIGLVVAILSLLQGIGGILRPHLPDSAEEKKSAIRTLWEFAHRASGIALLAMAWYQCYSGLSSSYLERFPDSKDYSDVFWGVAGSISAIVVVGALTRFVMPPPIKPKDDPVPPEQA